MADSKGPTSVRNLLAKFENNSNNPPSATTSPPSRGRSPTGSDRSASGRPMSKVRASFVAVERAAQSSPGPQPSGLRKSSELDDSPRKANDTSIDRRLGSPIDRPVTISPTGSIDKPALSRAPTSSPPTQASSTPWEKSRSDPQNPSTGKNTPPLGEILKGSPFEDSPAKNGSKPTTQFRSDPPQPKKEKENVAAESKADKQAKEAVVPKGQPANTAKAPSSRPSNLTMDKDGPIKSAAKRSPTGALKSPALPKSPKAPVTPGSRQPSTTTNSPAAKKETERPSRVLNKKPSSIRASSHPAGKNSTKPKTQQTRDNNGAKNSTRTSPVSKRTQPRSPTRPLRLPASMTTYTASSAAKLGNNGPSSRPASRATGNIAAHARKAPSSKAPGSTLSSTTAPRSTVRKQASHAALAPPPNSNTAHDRPKSRSSSSRAPEDSFLARMMRPTASSASKVHEKTEVKSPPRLSKTAKAAPQKRVSEERSDQQNGRTSKASARLQSPEQTHPTNGDSDVPKAQKSEVPAEADKLPSPVEQAEVQFVQQTSDEGPVPAESEGVATES